MIFERTLNFVYFIWLNIHVYIYEKIDMLHQSFISFNIISVMNSKNLNISKLIKCIFFYLNNSIKQIWIIKKLIIKITNNDLNKKMNIYIILFITSLLVRRYYFIIDHQLYNSMIDKLDCFNVGVMIIYCYITIR